MSKTMRQVCVRDFAHNGKNVITKDNVPKFKNIEMAASHFGVSPKKIEEIIENDIISVYFWTSLEDDSVEVIVVSDDLMKKRMYMESVPQYFYDKRYFKTIEKVAEFYYIDVEKLRDVFERGGCYVKQYFFYYDDSKCNTPRWFDYRVCYRLPNGYTYVYDTLYGMYRDVSARYEEKGFTYEDLERCLNSGWKTPSGAVVFCDTDETHNRKPESCIGYPKNNAASRKKISSVEVPTSVSSIKGAIKEWCKENDTNYEVALNNFQNEMDPYNEDA